MGVGRDKTAVERPCDQAIKHGLESHMMKEEQILFPMIRQGQGSRTAGPVAVMEHEHESAGGALERLRELTNG